MNISIKIALVIVAVIAALSIANVFLTDNQNAVPQSNQEMYTSALTTLSCENGATLTVQYSADASKALLSASGAQHKLVRDVSGSGARYIGETEAIIFWEHQDEVTITWPGQSEGFTCVVPGTETEEDPASGAETDNLIVVTSPHSGERVGNPIELKGMARGYWFFEASAPVVVTNWNGLIIGEGIITADGEWMTEDMVPFTGTLSYVIPENNYSATGTLIFMRDNPSGLPENDMAHEFNIILEE